MKLSGFASDRTRALSACSCPKKASTCRSRPSICARAKSRGRVLESAIRTARCRRSSSMTAVICREVSRDLRMSGRRNPTPAMIGTAPEERAECRMWTRRVDLNICEHLANGYRFGKVTKIFREANSLRAGGIPRPQDDRRQPPAMARRANDGQGLSVEQDLALADPPLLLARFRRPGRPAPRCRQQQHRGLDGARGRAALGKGLEYNRHRHSGCARAQARIGCSFVLVEYGLAQSLPSGGAKAQTVGAPGIDDLQITTGASGNSFGPLPGARKCFAISRDTASMPLITPRSKSPP